MVGLALLTLGYVFGEIGHFLIATTSKDVARDIHYGDLACQERWAGVDRAGYSLPTRKYIFNWEIPYSV